MGTYWDCGDKGKIKQPSYEDVMGIWYIYIRTVYTYIYTYTVYIYVCIDTIIYIYCTRETTNKWGCMEVTF